MSIDDLRRRLDGDHADAITRQAWEQARAGQEGPPPPRRPEGVPVPFVRRADWRTEARCRGVNPDLFYPERGAMEDVAAAKALCAECDVRVECLDFAMHSTSGRLGVWGGTTEKERRRMRRSRRGAA